MILFKTDDGFELTSDDLSVLLYMAGKSRGTRPKTGAEIHAEDVLWSLGWFVPTREAHDPGCMDEGWIETADGYRACRCNPERDGLEDHPEGVAQ